MSASFTSEQSYFLRATPSPVFRALTEPERLREWFLAAAELTPRKGGTFRFEWVGGYAI